MLARMCVCVCLCVCLPGYASTCILSGYAFMCVCQCMSICVYVSVCVYVCVSLCLYLCMSVYVSMCVYVCMYVRVCFQDGGKMKVIQTEGINYCTNCFSPFRIYWIASFFSHLFCFLRRTVSYQRGDY